MRRFLFPVKRSSTIWQDLTDWLDAQMHRIGAHRGGEGGQQEVCELCDQLLADKMEVLLLLHDLKRRYRLPATGNAERAEVDKAIFGASAALEWADHALRKHQAECGRCRERDLVREFLSRRQTRQAVDQIQRH